MFHQCLLDGNYEKITILQFLGQIRHGAIVRDKALVFPVHLETQRLFSFAKGANTFRSQPVFRLI
jgi:hypothetical protein